MKSLILMRHAKSSWAFPGLRDFDRPLSARGIRNAPEMGERLLNRSIKPGLMIASPANRTKNTAQLVAQKLSFPQERIVLEKKLYHAHYKEISYVISQQSDNYRSIMMLGHNPGFTDFVNMLLTEDRIENIPTAGVVVLNLRIKSWKEIYGAKADLFFFDYPKKKI